MSDLDRLAARRLDVEGVEFVFAPLGGTPGSDLIVVKSIDEVERYRRVLAHHTAPRMVELGIAYGGSVALLATLAQPTRLVAIELATERQPVLDAFIESRGLDDRVHLHYGVDQADRHRLREIMEIEFGGEQLDVVVDDASHLYRETLVTFETLFPLLRPGGDYIIEDWSCDHGIRTLLIEGLEDEASPYHHWAHEALKGRIPSRHDGQAAQTAIAVASIPGGEAELDSPLSLIALQLVLAAAEGRAGIAGVTVCPDWVRVERNDVPLDRDQFDLRAIAPDHFRLLS